MNRSSVLATAAALLMAATTADAGAKKPRKRRLNPAMAPVEDKQGLPRVLLIGDSISIGYTVPTRKALEGKANVHRPQANCGPTTRGLQAIDQWLGDGKWDVIHFNWGLHDLKYISAKGGLTDVDKGKQQVPIGQYEANLEKLVLRLKKTGAKLIWASTTPVPEGATHLGQHHPRARGRQGPRPRRRGQVQRRCQEGDGEARRGAQRPLRLRQAPPQGHPAPR